MFHIAIAPDHVPALRVVLSLAFHGESAVDTLGLQTSISPGVNAGVKETIVEVSPTRVL